MTTVPNILWHYTDVGGLEGIVRTGNLRMGDARFLNDRTERRYGTDFVSQITAAAATGANSLSLIAVTRSSFDSAGTDSNLHVCSFSERNDSISQWQRYGADGYGYCIGFDTSFMRNEWLKEVSASLLQMVYESEQQEKLVRARLRSLLRKFNPERPRGASARRTFIERTGLTIAKELEEIALQLKHPLFRDEVEWRVIRKVRTKSLVRTENEATYFAARGHYVKPYLEIGLPKSSARGPIVNVVCGPRLDGDLAMLSARHFLSTLGYSAVSVTWSELHEIWR